MEASISWYMRPLITIHSLFTRPLITIHLLFTLTIQESHTGMGDIP
jgi:hypothetical protein